MYPLKQSISVERTFFAHDANGDAVTGKIDGNWTKSIRKQGGTSWSALSVTVTELTAGSKGWYRFTLGTVDTNTLGELDIVFEASGVKQVNLKYLVQARLPDDLAFPATSGRSIQVETDGMVHADVKEWLGAAPAALTSSGYVQAMLLRWLTDNVAGTPNALIANRVDANAQAVGDKSGYTLASITGQPRTDLMGEDASFEAGVGTRKARIDSAISSRSSHSAADVWAVGTRTLTAFGFAVDLSATALAAIWDRLTSALITTGSIGKLIVDNLNATVASRSSHAAADVWTVGTRTLTAFGFAVNVSAQAVTDIWGATTRTLTGLGAALVQEIWDRATSALTTIGSIGKLLVDNVNATIGSRSSHSAADVWTSGTRTLTASLDPTAAQIADAVWDEALADHLGAGSTGKKLDDIPTSGTGDWTAAEKQQIRDALGVDGTKTAATGGQLQAIKTKTDQLVFTIANKVDASIQTAADFAQAAADKVWASVSRTLTAFGFSVTVGTNNDKTGYALTSGERDSIRDVVQQGLYEEGSVWIDTVNGVAGTTSFVHGTQHNPVNNIADATTLATNLKLKRFHIAIGSTITLAQAYTGYRFWGRTWTLILNGQTVTDCYFEGAIVVGTSVGAGQKYHLCAFGTVTIPPCAITDSVFTATFTMPSAGAYHIDGCYSEVASDDAPPIFNYGTAVGQNNDLNLNHYSGGVEIQNMGQSGTDTLSLGGRGRLIFNANVTGGTARVRGLFNITNNGTPTLTDDANFMRSKVVDETWDEASADHGVAGSVGERVERLDLIAAGGAGGLTNARAANLDNLDAAVSSRAAAGDAMTLTPAERDTAANALLDLAHAVETGLTTRGALRLALAALAGKASGLHTATAVYRNVGDTKPRITATVDADGNRSAVTVDPT